VNRPKPKTDGLTAFLRQYLADGPRPVGDVKSAAKAQGYRKDLIEAVSEDTTLIEKKRPRRGQEEWFWKLAALPPSANPTASPGIWPYPFSPCSLSASELMRMLTGTNDPLIVALLFHLERDATQEGAEDALEEREKAVDAASDEMEDVRYDATDNGYRMALKDVRALVKDLKLPPSIAKQIRQGLGRLKSGFESGADSTD
jgi:hypothetical protein